MPKALFFIARRHLWICEREWFIKNIHALPFFIALAVYFLFDWVITTKLLCAKSTGDIRAEVDSIVSINTFFLGAMATVILVFKQGLIDKSHKELAESRLKELCDILQITHPNSASVADFKGASLDEINRIFDSLTQCHRLFSWTCTSLFLLATGSIVLLFLCLEGPIYFISSCWHHALSATYACIVLFGWLFIIALWPRLVKHHVLKAILENPSDIFSRFEEEIKDTETNIKYWTTTAATARRLFHNPDL